MKEKPLIYRNETLPIWRLIGVTVNGMQLTRNERPASEAYVIIRHDNEI